MCMSSPGSPDQGDKTFWLLRCSVLSHDATLCPHWPVNAATCHTTICVWPSSPLNNGSGCKLNICKSANKGNLQIGWVASCHFSSSEHCSRLSLYSNGSLVMCWPCHAPHQLMYLQCQAAATPSLLHSVELTVYILYKNQLLNGFSQMTAPWAEQPRKSPSSWPSLETQTLKYPLQHSWQN